MTTLNLPTTQALFDHVAKHLLTQGQRSIAGKQCRYRAYTTAGTLADTLSCAVGCLITDQNYTPELEDKGPGNPKVRVAVEASIGRIPDAREVDMLHSLQACHDQHGPDGWPSKLADIARSHHLSLQVIEEHQNAQPTTD